MSSKDAVDADSELAIIREFFDNVDLDCSGYIDETELAAVVDLPPHEIKEIFKKLDTDGDGRISIEEFTENYKHFQSYAEQLGKNSHNNNEFSIEDSRHSLTPKQRGAERDGGYATAEPMHRKNHPLIQTDIKRKAAKFLGQEYLDDLYEVARSRDDPMLLESLENFLTATVESLLQKQADNEKLDTALKRATEKSTEMTAQLEEEMEHQVAVMEQKFRQEEQAKLEQQKHEANVQLMMANNELEEMERKIVDLENKIVDQAKKDAEIPDHFIDKIRKKDLENQQLQQRLLDFQTQMSVMRTEVSAMKSEYDEQSSRLENERGTVLSCVQEQESLTRQLQLLHEANKKLHDTNDDLRSALDVKRSNSMMSTTETSPVKRSASCAYPRPFTSHDQLSSFRSDPGAIRNSTMNNDLNDTDEDSAGQSIPRDEDDDDDADVINERSLLKELMTAENQRSYDNPILGALPRSQSMMSSQHGSYLNTSTGVLSDRDQFLRQLEMLSETNRRLGESNDELRNALSLLSDQVRSERGSDTMSLRQSPQGCYSAPVTPFRENYQEERPNSTSSPRKVLLTKSGYNPLSESRSMPDLTSKYTTRGNDDDSKLSTCSCGIRLKSVKGSVTLCDVCLDNDTDAIVDEISFDESLPVDPSSDVTSTMSSVGQLTDKNSTGNEQRKSHKSLPVGVFEPETVKQMISENENTKSSGKGRLIGEPTPFHQAKYHKARHQEEEEHIEISFDESLPVDPSLDVTSTMSSVGQLTDKNSTGNEQRKSHKSLPVGVFEPETVEQMISENENTKSSGKGSLIGEPTPFHQAKYHKARHQEEEEHIEPIEVRVENSLDDLFHELASLPSAPCDVCGQQYCSCVATEDEYANRSLNQLAESTMLTDSDSDGYSEQETGHFPDHFRRLKASHDHDKGQDATYETTNNDMTSTVDTFLPTAISGSSAMSRTPNRSKLLFRNLDKEMSMYARHQSDEEVDEDDMPDEELIRLVDQTNEDSASLTDEPITVEEKILEPLRYPAVGSSEGESVSSVNTGHGEPDEMFKLVLAGNAAVGKSSFIIRLSKNKFYSALNSTLGVDFQMKTLEVDQQNIALQLWDTAGQERFRSIAKSYFRRVDGVILLYDVTCESSFLDVRDWIESIESSSSNKVPIILCGNKVDLRAQALKIGMPVVTRAQGRQLANEVGALFIETSAKDGTNIHKACKDLIRLMQKVEEEDEKPTGMTLENNTAVNKPKKAGCCRS